MIYHDQFASLDQRSDDSEKAVIANIVNDVKASLKDYEEYFLQETIKKLRLDGQGSSKKITKTIRDVVINDENQYLQEVPTYKKYQSASSTMADAMMIYIESLKEKFVEGFSNEEVDMLINSYIGFLQRKDELLEHGRLNEEYTDIDNFMDITKKSIKDQDDADKTQKFLEKIANCIEEKTYTQEELLQALDNSKNNLLPQEQIDLKYIRDGLEIIVGTSYQQFILDFLNKTKKNKPTSVIEVELIVEELLKAYLVGYDLEEKIPQITDYLQRLKSIMIKNV